MATTKGSGKDKAMTAPPETTALAEVDFGEDAGQGFENVSNADMILPLLIVVQDNTKSIPKEKAKGGQIFNTSTQRAADWVEIVPAVTDHCYLEWNPRDAGGGFRGRHALDSAVVKHTLGASQQRIGKHKTMRMVEGKLVPSGTELVEAFEIWAVVGDGNGMPDGFALISCTSTKIRPYRQLTTKLRHFQVPRPGGGKQDVPLFANRTIVRTVPDKNAKGDFFNFSFDPFTKGTPPLTDLLASMVTGKHPMYMAGKELRQLVSDGKVSADYASTEDDSADAGGAANEAADTAF